MTAHRERQLLCSMLGYRVRPLEVGTHRALPAAQRFSWLNATPASSNLVSLPCCSQRKPFLPFLSLFHFLLFLLLFLRIKPRPWSILGKYSASEPCSQAPEWSSRGMEFARSLTSSESFCSYLPACTPLVLAPLASLDSLSHP